MAEPSPFLATIRAVLIDKEGKATWSLQKLFQDWDTRLTKGLNLLGEFIGTLSSSATVAGRAGTLGSALQNLNATGILSAAAISGTIASGSIPAPTPSSLGGVQSNTAIAHNWVNSINTSGVPTLSQPDFTDISGSVDPAQLPAPSLTTLGGVKASTVVPHNWLTRIDTTGAPQAAQPAFTDISGTLGLTQRPATVPAVTFGVGAPAAAATDGDLYFDTTGSPYHGYVYQTGAWHIFS